MILLKLWPVDMQDGLVRKQSTITCFHRCPWRGLLSPISEDFRLNKSYSDARITLLAKVYYLETERIAKIRTTWLLNTVNMFISFVQYPYMR